MSDLKDKVVLVTDLSDSETYGCVTCMDDLIRGSSSGIGEGIAIHLSGLGAKLTLTGRDEKNLQRVANLCKSVGSDDLKILCVVGDIRSQTIRESLVSKTVEKFGRLDVLVNNAGIAHACGAIAATEEQYDEILNVNVKAVFFLTQIAIPHLKESKGNIINISSNGGDSPAVAFTPYCMSKAAIDMYTKCLSLELASSGVRVNAISPGLIETRILRRPGLPYVEEEAFRTFMKEFAENIPVGRYGQPKEIAKAVAFLASNEQASFITGDIMYIDGAHRFLLH